MVSVAGVQKADELIEYPLSWEFNNLWSNNLKLRPSLVAFYFDFYINYEEKHETCLYIGLKA